ncbi:MAG: amidinotransferase [Saprospiraceae bacterium]|nr:amidinotransferase [Saprospiraceae bacterium]
MEKHQTTSNILMVRPANFGFNPETAANNAFQVNDTSLTVAEIQQKAVAEFDNFVNILRGRAVHVFVAQDSASPVKTDAVFPNNWITSHGDGTMVLYPMFSKNRRLERDSDVMHFVENQFIINKILHLEHYEEINSFLEGTGSMILDRKNEICYACLSPRTDLTLLDEWCDLMHHKRVAFRAVDGQGKDIYHTNVMMALGETFVVICLETIQDVNERLDLIKHFELTSKDIIEISLAQMMSFAGNMLQVRNDFDETFLVMSKQAYDSLNATQIAHIQRHTEILYADIKTIETYGGGSARCMLAEIFFEKK